MKKQLSSTIKYSLGLILASVLLTSSASAVILTPTYGFSPQNAGFTSDFDGPNQAAIGFQLGSNATVTKISWLGLYSGSSGVLFSGFPTDNFTIRLFENDSGFTRPVVSPSLLNANMVTVDRTNVGHPFSQEYSYELTSGVDLLAGTTYWLSLVNDTTGSDSDWTWNHNSGGSPIIGSGRRTSDGDTWAAHDRDLQFQLEGTVSAVPVPAAVWLMGSGLISLLTLRRKKVV